MYLTRIHQCDRNVNFMKHSFTWCDFKRYIFLANFLCVILMCNFCKIMNLIIAYILFSIFSSSNFLQCIIADREWRYIRWYLDYWQVATLSKCLFNFIFSRSGVFIPSRISDLFHSHTRNNGVDIQLFFNKTAEFSGSTITTE